jgi:O-antigen/teichoic acid export membrane protein
MDDAPEEPPVTDRYARGRLARGGAITVAGNLAGKLIGIIPIAVLTRELSVEGMGVFSFGVGFAVFVGTLSDLGVDQVAVRELARRPDERERVLGGAIVGKGVAVAISLTGALAVSFLYEPRLQAAALLAVLTVVTSVPTTLALALTADVRLAGQTAVAVGGALLNAVALLVALLAGGGPLVLLAVQTGAQLVAGTALTVVARRGTGLRIELDLGEARALLRDALPLAATTAAVVVYARIDQLLLAALDDETELAHYGVAVRVVDTFNVLPVAVARVMLPALSHLREVSTDRGNRLARRGFRYLAAAILPIAALGTAAAGPLLTTAFGADYGDSGALVAILLWAHWAAFVWLVAQPVLIADRRIGVLAVLAIAGALVNVVLNLVLIPPYGARGAAWASLVAYATPLAGGVLVGGTRPVFVAAVRSAVRPAAAALVVLAVLVSVTATGGGTVVLLAAFAVVTPVALVATKAMAWPEIQDLVLSSIGRGGGGHR